MHQIYKNKNRKLEGRKLWIQATAGTCKFKICCIEAMVLIDPVADE